ncbi:hypothetical protein PPL_08969 [Heterostelium album PN500]|uniref:Uncharacterized protein n=1 Tax=Heterostelium pallidum (strain ATCC 26659 / Pp 5 / PN500) TaxID=670386 RepID=D3BK88_HETP5|nr:hypothetical protein PPL_08969 [Heterostelium album PN500]EFA78318.1 hypothetical protein PPL_08969 [Heterostelium album PN500]|eukprot:XP_020430443.1 hypothetical protein PPL_08969 [Heterostelium album PN500]
MEKLKNRLFKAIETNGAAGEFSKLAAPKSEEMNMTEFLTWLPSKHHESLFDSLLNNKLIPLIEEELLVPSTEDQDIDSNTSKTILIDSLKSFESIIHICHCYIKIKENTNPPEQLFQIATIFHSLLLPMLNLQMQIESTQLFSKDILLRLSKLYGKIANEISLLCEIWFKQDRPNKEELVPQTIGYLVQKAFESTVVAGMACRYRTVSAAH